MLEFHTNAQESDSDQDTSSDFVDFEELVHVQIERTDFSPFSSRNEALLFMLHHSPRPIGESNMKFILFMMKQCDPTIPSLDVLKRFIMPDFVAPLKDTCNGTDFYTILPTTVLKQCFANPEMARKIIRYPEVPNSEVKELYHAERWHREFPSLMTTHNDFNIFLYDFVAFQNAEFGDKIGKVLKIFTKEGDTSVYLQISTLLSINQMWVVHPEVVVLNPDETAFVLHEEKIISINRVISVVEPPLTIMEVHNYRLSALDFQAHSSFIEKHPIKVVSGGLPVIVAPLILFSDDTSGNRSKKWNKFDYWCLTLACLPVSEARMFHNMHFLTCSNRLSSLEIAGPLVEDLKVLEKGFVLYDSLLQKDVMVIAPVMAVLCDNARASELLNHLGSRATKFCRRCMTDSNHPSTIGELRTKALALQQIDEINQVQTESSRKARRTEFGMREDENPLFGLNVDLFRSMPVEVLHTILLGASKYMLRTFMDKLNASQKKEILARIASFCYCGFSVRITGNIAYHYKSFIGRDFKAWMQMALFIIHSYISNDEKKCWLALSKLFRVAYCLPVTTETLDECSQICQDFVSSITTCSPEYSRRLKVHILLHLPHDMREFGPTSLFNTERFESFNSLMRNQNIYSNRHSPSKDIATSFSIIEHLRFICSGGKLTADGFCAGDGLKELYAVPQVQQFLNFRQPKDIFSTKTMYQPGSLRKLRHGAKPMSLGEVSCQFYCDTSSASLSVLISQKIANVHLLEGMSEQTSVLPFGAVIASSRELTNKGDFIEINSSEIQYGVLIGIVQTTESLMSFCMVRKFERILTTDGTALTNEFDCPLLTLTSDVYCITPSLVCRPVSIVHECGTSCHFLNGKFIHDYSNFMFCFNIFCTGNY